MRKWLLAILLACAVAGVVWYFFVAPPKESQTAASPSQSESPSTAAGMPSSNSRTGATAPSPASPDAPPPPGPRGPPADTTATPAKPFVLGSADAAPSMDAATVLSNMRVTINQYRSMFGENPVGTNPEITKALNGDN